MNDDTKKPFKPVPNKNPKPLMPNMRKNGVTGVPPAPTKLPPKKK